ncbi:Ornithine carbamoyltransferase [Maioricimonas rarisocia]|uniref:Ornithine carbamoyltransferase n=1 Tax=Maioricimonas rarisocia TaxID=2528026 RepID=A0A517ZDV1_9PLAN|nr:ornithine carbamoyltransferase [Maioricimonas rarisocia]QDU40648.1 Ornithine carbamoyltransferase [Maioricimonas rarisocia]
MQNLTTLLDLSRAQIEQIFETSARLKQGLRDGERPPLLAGRVVTQLFEKPSLRTRLSFEAGVQQLGGGSIFLSGKDAGLNGREDTRDVARVVGSYSDVIVLRTFAQSLIDDFAAYAGCVVVNGLSDASHPCQALTDLLTVQEAFGQISGVTIAYVGDGNNVAASLAELCAVMEVPFRVASPEGYTLPDEFLAGLKKQFPAADIEQVIDPAEAVRGAQVVYTDVWASMGQESEKEARARVFAPYQVNANLMAEADKEAKFMHCLPARRGLEVTEEVMESPQSIAFQQAENRMHLAKGLLVTLLGAG